MHMPQNAQNVHMQCMMYTEHKYAALSLHSQEAALHQSYHEHSPMRKFMSAYRPSKRHLMSQIYSGLSARTVWFDNLTPAAGMLKLYQAGKKLLSTGVVICGMA